MQEPALTLHWHRRHVYSFLGGLLFSLSSRFRRFAAFELLTQLQISMLAERLMPLAMPMVLRELALTLHWHGSRRMAEQ